MEHSKAPSGRLVDPIRDRFWDWQLQSRDLLTTSGKIGQSGRTTTKAFPEPCDAESELERKIYAKLREGFLHFGRDNPGPIALQTWLTNVYTGFQSIDLDVRTNRIAAGRHTGKGGQSCEIVLLDAETGAVEERLPLAEFDVSTVRFFEDDLIAQSNDRVMRIDLRSGASIILGGGGIFPFLPFDIRAGRMLLSRASSAGPVVQVIDLRSSAVLLELDARKQTHAADHHIRPIGALSPSGNLAALCRLPGEIEVHDLRSGRCKWLRGEFPCVTKIEFHPSENRIGFTEFYEGWRFRLWHLEGGGEDTRFESLEYLFTNGEPRRARECFDFAFSPDGRALALRDCGSIRVHDFESQAPIARYQQRHVAKSAGKGGFRLVWAPDGRLITRTDLGILTVYFPP